MRGLNDIKMKPKLIGTFLILGLVPLLLVAAISINRATDSLMAESFSKLESVQAIKSNQISDFFDSRLLDAQILADLPQTIDAVKDLDGANTTAKERHGITGQALLDDVAYKATYNNYNPTFTKFIETYGYYDIFLICPEDGDVFYSACREADFGTELGRENTNLAFAWKKALQTGRPVMSEMEAYAPSAGAPAMFVAAPVRDRGEVIGVLAMQISNDEINAVMQERSGMGESGETYLVGSDKLMRSDSFLNPSGHSVEASFAGNVAKNGVDTDAVRNAIAGRSGSEVITDYNGNLVLSVYSPLTISDDISWICIAEIDLAEVRIPINSMRNSIIVIGVIFGLIIVLIGFLVASGISNPIQKITEAAQQIELGNLNDEIPIAQNDEIGILADVFRNMQDGLQNKADAAEAIAGGNLQIDIQVASNEDVLGNSMAKMRASLQDMQTDLQETIEQQKAGNIDDRCNPDKFSGAYSELLTGVNDVLESVICPLLKTSDILQQYAQGDLSNQMHQLPGKQAVLSSGLNNIQQNLRALIDAGVGLTKAAKEGDLETRGDTSMFSGGYLEIISGMNSTLDAVIEPIKEASVVLGQIADGDFSTKMTGNYNGDHNTMKKAINETVDSLNKILGQVNASVDQVSTGAQQVSDSSQSLSQGATQQAASMEEVSASVEEIGAQTKQNADSASEANQLVTHAGDSASVGSEHMQQMLVAMSEISDSSTQVQKIIKVIDEIAFQTNLLALNAAVEAARAGVHGKGFAVVAEEVRNLAQRSAKAASETTELIEGSVAKTENGGRIAQDTANALAEIVDGVTKVKDLIGEIDSASREQSTAISQISEVLIQIDQVTQSNSATSEESAATSEELAGQANQLYNMVSRFKLAQTRVSSGLDDVSTPLGFKDISHEVEQGMQKPTESGNQGDTTNGNEEISIDLAEMDDNEFGDF